MASLIENLKVFNRRERFFVVGWALDNPLFTLGTTFRHQFAASTGMEIPADAFCAMDFPFDWLVGCLWLTKEKKANYSILETGEVNRNNEDTDLVIAYEDGGKTQLLMIEAKGVTGWQNRQLRSKALRLGRIFGTGVVADKWPTVHPHFFLASPKKPEYIDVTGWPLWMTKDGEPRGWLELLLPSDLRKIVRCDEDGRKNHSGGFWKIV
jgi:hypothetical protein